MRNKKYGYGKVKAQ